jgi:hypothetical protein
MILVKRSQLCTGKQRSRIVGANGLQDFACSLVEPMMAIRTGWRKLKFYGQLEKSFLKKSGKKTTKKINNKADASRLYLFNGVATDLTLTLYREPIVQSYFPIRKAE